MHLLFWLISHPSQFPDICHLSPLNIKVSHQLNSLYLNLFNEDSLHLDVIAEILLLISVKTGLLPWAGSAISDFLHTHWCFMIILFTLVLKITMILMSLYQTLSLFVIFTCSCLSHPFIVFKNIQFLTPCLFFQRHLSYFFGELNILIDDLSKILHCMFLYLSSIDLLLYLGF